MSDPQQGGEVLGRGGFRLDRRRALDKLERFQLEDPRRYVLELIAAAVLGGATRFELTQDRDEATLTWDGARPTGEELDGLFDHLFGQPEEPRAALLQHLGVGLLGALGLRPAALRVEVGDGERGVVLDLDTLTETRHRPADRPVDGVRVYVREALGRKLLSRGLLGLLVAEPDECVLVRGAAAYAPLRVRVNGEDLPRAPEPEVWAARLERPEGTLWLVPDTLGGHQVLLRHGLVVHTQTLPGGPFRVVGSWRADTLHLNASRSAVVEDARLQAVNKVLGEARVALLCSLVDPADEAEPLSWAGTGPYAGKRYVATRGELREAARAHFARGLARIGELPEALRDVPLTTDAFGRRYSARELSALREPPGWFTAGPADPELPRAQLPAADRELIAALRPDAEDLDPLLALRARGRERQQRAPQLPRELPTGPQRTFEEGPLWGAVGWPEGEPRAGFTHTRLGLRGREVQVRAMPTPGLTLRAVLNHDGLQPITGWDEVAEDSAFTQALRRLAQEGERFVLERARGQGADAEQALGAYTALVQARARTTVQPSAAAELWALNLGAPLMEAPVLQRATGARLSLAELLAAPQPWLTLPPESAELALRAAPELAERALLLPPRLIPVWGRLLGPRLDTASKPVSDAVERARRLAEPRRVPTDTGPSAEQVHSFAGPALRGVLGWSPSGAAQAQIRLLRDGVEVGTLALDLGLAGVAGEVDWPEAPVDAAHAALVGEGAKRLAALLLPEVHALALALWDRVGSALNPALTAWLRSVPVQKAPPPGALRRPLGARVGGAPWTLEDLTQLSQTRRKGEARLMLLSQDPEDMPGFERAVVLGPHAREVVRAWAPGAVSVKDDDLARAQVQLQAYMQRPPYAEPGPVLARVTERGPDWQGELLLSGHPEHIGRLRVVVLWRGRVLAERHRSSTLGGLYVLQGPGVKPSRSLEGSTATELLQQAVERAGRAFPELLQQAWEAHGPQRSTAALGSWRALLAQVLQAEGRGKRAAMETLEQARLFPTLGGQTLSLQELRAPPAAGQPWSLVDAATLPGPADHGGYVLAAPGVQAALAAALPGGLPRGDDALARWRALQRKATRRVEPRLSGSWLVQAPLTRPGVVGELGLGLGEPGLTLRPLVDGVPLEPIQRLFPVQAEVVVQGAGVEADRNAERALETPALQALLQALTQEVEQAVLAAALRLRSDAERQLTLRWVLGAQVPGAAVQAPVFPTLDGGHLSLAELTRRQAEQGAVGYVDSALPHRAEDLALLRGGPSPLRLRGEVVGPLGRLVRLIDVGARTSLARKPHPKGGQPLPALGPGSVGALGVSEGQDAVVLHRGELAVQTLSPGGPLPLAGWVHDPALPLKPTLDGAQPGPALDALLQALRGVSERALEELLQGPMSPADQAQLRGILRRLCPDEPTLRAALGPGEGPTQRLARAALFRDSADQSHTLAALAALPQVRVVAPGSRGEPAPGGLPFLGLGAEERAWLGQVLDLVDGQTALAAEHQGALRRRGPKARRPRPPFGTPSQEASFGPAQVSVWLELPEPSTLAGLVDGVQVQELPSPIPGMRGWVDGPLPTDPGFTRVELPAELRAGLWSLGVALWLAEAQRDASGQRLALARLARLGKALDALLQAHPELGALAPLRDLEGRSLSLLDLREATRGRAVVWVPPGHPAPDGVEPGQRVLVLDTLRRDLLADLLPPNHLLSPEDLRRAQEKRQAKQTEERVQGAGKRARRDAERVRAALRHLGQELGDERLYKAGAPTIKSWGEFGLPSELAAAPEGAARDWLAAWEAAFGPGAEPNFDPQLELRLLAVLARKLR